MFGLKDKQKILNTLERSSLGGIPLIEVLPKIGMILVLAITIPLMFPSGRSLRYTDLQEGSIATKKVIAPFPFTVRKNPTELEKERAKIPSGLPSRLEPES